VRKHNESLKSLIRSIRSEGLAISVIVYGEVTEGVLFSRERAPNLIVWNSFLAGVDVLDITQPISDVWADLRGTLRSRGMIVPDNDLLIASTAMYFDMTVVTLNARHFERVAGLKLLVPEL
jgi:tRNA(fMet)-specific endonuclease VapC